MTDEKALVKTNVPSHLAQYAGSTEGTDHMSREDLKLPRLAIAQKMSPQLDEQDGKYVEGLKFLDLFNDLTGQIYGKGPIRFSVARADAPRAVEFAKDGSVVDFDVPLTDPRVEFFTDQDGKRQKPLATKFYDYVVILWESNEVLALSLKGTGIRAAVLLNSLIKLRAAPVWTGVYELAVGRKEGAEGTYGVHQFRNAGFVSEDEAVFAKQMFETLKDRKLVVERETPEAVPF